MSHQTKRADQDGGAGRDEDRRRLIAALDRLPQIERIVYLLAATDGLSYGEIGFRLGQSVEVVQGILADALAHLGAILDEL